MITRTAGLGEFTIENWDAIRTSETLKCSESKDSPLEQTFRRRTGLRYWRGEHWFWLWLLGTYGQAGSQWELLIAPWCAWAIFVLRITKPTPSSTLHYFRFTERSHGSFIRLQRSRLSQCHIFYRTLQRHQLVPIISKNLITGNPLTFVNHHPLFSLIIQFTRTTLRLKP